MFFLFTGWEPFRQLRCEDHNVALVIDNGINLWGLERRFHYNIDGTSTVESYLTRCRSIIRDSRPLADGLGHSQR